MLKLKSGCLQMFVVFVPFFQQLDPIQICEVQQNDALAGPEACQVRRHKPATLKDVERWKMLNQNLKEVERWKMLTWALQFCSVFGSDDIGLLAGCDFIGLMMYVSVKILIL